MSIYHDFILFHIIKLCRNKDIRGYLYASIGNHRLPVETERWDDIPLNERNCNVCTTSDIGDEYHYLLTCDFF